MLSGYCIHRAHVRSLDEGKLDLGRFAWRRIKRIHPVLVGALFLTAALDTWVVHHYPAEPKLGDLSWQAFLGNVLSVQNLLTPTYGTNRALWTLSIELHLYAVYPVYFWLSRNLGGTRAFAITLVISALAAIGTFPYPVLEYAFPPFWFLWTLGAFVAEWEAAPVRAPRWPYLPLSLASITACMALPSLPRAQDFLSGFALAVWVAWSIKPTTRIFEGRFGSTLAWVGLFSYSLYAIHTPLLVFLRNFVLRGRLAENVLVAMAGAAVAVGVAWVFFHGVERWTVNSPRAERTGTGSSSSRDKQPESTNG